MRIALGIEHYELDKRVRVALADCVMRLRRPVAVHLLTPIAIAALGVSGCTLRHKVRMAPDDTPVNALAVIKADWGLSAMIDIEGVDGVRTRHKSLWSTGRVTQIEVTPGRHEIELRASFPYDGVETEENPRITFYAESGKTYLLRAEVIKKRVWEEVRRELAGETSYAAVWLIDAATNTVVAGSEPPQPDGATQADQR